MLPELIDAGAGALKLEGRMKAPDYVHSVTRAYREALDDAIAETTPSADDARDRAAVSSGASTATSPPPTSTARQATR